MPISKVAKRYSKGLYDFASENNQLETVAAEMQDLLVLLNQSKDFSSFFNNPFIDSQKKIAASKDIFKSFSALSNNFITLCIKNGREKHLKDIATYFVQSVEDKNSVQRISITSASALSKENIDSILAESKIVDATKKCNVNTFVKSELLGGYIIRVGDQQIDLSLRTQISAIKKQLELK